jgi:4-hydroxybenzoate polyprenyltransferase
MTWRRYSVAVLRSLRLHQWVKNALVFVPLMLGGRALDISVWADASIGFVAFGLTASGTYIVNDLRDRAYDQAHPMKRHRPVANGELSQTAAIVLATTCLLAGLAIGLWIGFDEFTILMIYLTLTVAYTFWLKRLPVVDVFTIATFFSLRLAFGVVLSDVRWSPWLFVLSMCAFLSLALAKRFAELSGSRTGAALSGRGYVLADLPFIRGLGLAAATTAVLIVILYLIEEAFPHALYDHPQRLWAAPVILFLFFGRIWIAAERGELSEDDPVAFALMDRTCLFYGLCLLLDFVAAVV